jgi:phosphoadenosine phosphosulfate reductase
MPTADTVTPAVDPAAVDRRLSDASATERIAWALGEFGNSLVLSTSFGVQAAVMLHLATRLAPDIPVIFIDTGYLFPETYLFADLLTKRLKVNLKVYRAAESPAWIEARHGKLWEKGAEGIAAYNQIAKVEPMQRALNELGSRAWLAGLRRVQASTREQLPVVSTQDGRVKVLPPALGEGICVDRGRAHDASAHRRHDARGDPLLRPQARMRPPRRLKHLKRQR